MTRSKKLIILAAALAVICGAALLAAKLNPDKNGTAEEQDTVVFSLDGDEVTALAWDYEEPLAFSREGGEWTYDADSSFPVKAAYLDTMVSALEEITAYTVIENAEDPAQYGLDEPVCTVTVTTDAGETVLSMGNESPMGGQRYLSLDGSAVYLVDSAILDSFAYGLYDVISKESVPDMSDIVSFDVSAETRSLHIDRLEDSGRAYSDSYVWFAGTEDGYVTLDTALTESFTANVTKLAWNSCVDYAADDGTLEDYGLDAPAATVTVTYAETTEVDTNETDAGGNAVTGERTEERTFVLELGDYSGSYCYARIAGSPTVYLVDAAVSDAMLYTGIDSLLPDDVLEMDWAQVNAVDITLDGVTCSLTHETVEETDGEDTVSKRSVWLMDGEEVDLTSSLNTLTGLGSVGSAAGLSPERDEILSLRIHQDSELWPEVEVIFYAYDSASCLETLNGEATLFVSRTDIDDLAEVLTALLAPETGDAAEPAEAETAE